MPLRVEHDGPISRLGILEFGFLPAEFDHVIDPFLQLRVLHAEIDVEHLLLFALYLRPHGREIIVVFLESDVYIAIVRSDDDEIIGDIALVPAEQLAVEIGERYRILAVQDHFVEADFSDFDVNLPFFMARLWRCKSVSADSYS